MFVNLRIAFMLFCLHQTECTWPRINVSDEHRLRQELFFSGASLDRMVRPVLKSSDAVKVNFTVELKSIVDVDKKGQIVSTDTFITQRWNNSFLMWTPSVFGGLEKILVSPEEIWAPDIVLQNNADDNIAQAGYTEKLKTWIIIYHNGTSEWISPVSFKSTCKLDVTFFPYDQHLCDMVFGSLTMDKTLMDIEIEERHVRKGKDKDDDEGEDHDGDEEFEQVETSASWSIQMIEVKRREKRFKGYPYPFSEVHLRFVIRRKPLHFLAFSMVPCMLIGALILLSFFIPAESGERIGFSCTILITVSVYLLIMTEALPEQSDTLPLIGVYYIIIMIEIGLALTATIIVLKAHHATIEPPALLKSCLLINSIYRCCRRPKTKRTSKIKQPVQVSVNDCDSSQEENQNGTEDKHLKTSVTDMSQLSVNSGSQMFTHPSTVVEVEEEDRSIYRCCRRPKTKRTSKVKPSVQVSGIDCDSSQEENHNGTEDKHLKTSVIDMRRLSVNSGSQIFTRPSSVVEVEDEDRSETWRQIGKALDRFFFWTFVISFFISTAVVFSYGPSLAQPLNRGVDRLYRSR